MYSPSWQCITIFFIAPSQFSSWCGESPKTECNPRLKHVHDSGAELKLIDGTLWEVLAAVLPYYWITIISFNCGSSLSSQLKSGLHGACACE